MVFKKKQIAFVLEKMEINLNYPVYIGDKYLNDLNIILEDFEDQYSRLYIIVDENTHEKCLPQLLHEVEMLEGAQVIQVPVGEGAKNFDIAQYVWTTLTEDNADRKTLIVNLGGGIVTDLGGFVASAYKRGVRFIQIPTSLLAQVDASVGSKVGINFGGYKNQIGAFADPMLVLICPLFLDTLDNRQLLSGFAEVLKHALIYDKAYWEYLKEQDEMNWPVIIEKSVQIKTDVVLKDPKEEGLRKILNFGHTMAHAFEAYAAEQELDILHGEAVAFGMVCEAYLSHKYLNLSQEALTEITEAICGIYVLEDFKEIFDNKCLKYCKQDKKNEDDRILLSLLSELGQCKPNIEVEMQDLEKALDYLNTQIGG